ncbi:MAG: NADH-quinone oxidoreductase subunit J [Deltaproteobacteria bacterium]|nr:NADH-quinone oxidoreductase subunit J [Deltaproteobacteria bacterium]
MDSLLLATAQAANVTTAPGKAQVLFFWLFALLAVGGSAFMITRRNAVAAVMSLVGTILAVAALYVMLLAHFLAVIQVLVYAGAIMVLFIFVIMLLNKEEDEPWALRGLLGKGVAGLGLAYLVARMVSVLWSVGTRVGEEPWSVEQMQSFGSTRDVGRVLFSTYLFPFEAVSIVLLIAVVGALVLARPMAKREGK